MICIETQGLYFLNSNLDTWSENLREYLILTLFRKKKKGDSMANDLYNEYHTWL